MKAILLQKIKKFSLRSSFTSLIIPALAISFLAQCSFMPDELESFHSLSLPDLEKGGYEEKNTKISYVVSGNLKGRPVIFIHGTPGSWGDWKLVLVRSRLTENNFLIAVDRPGWGGSTADKTFPRISQQAKLLKKILSISESDKKAILVGHSLGGPIALRMALDYPEKIGALVLLAPSLDHNLDAVLWYNRAADYFLIKAVLPDLLSKANDEILALPGELRQLEKDMASLTMPVLLVHGDKDELVDPKNSDFARKKLINAKYQEIRLPNFGHLIPQLRPAEVVLAAERALSILN